MPGAASDIRVVIKRPEQRRDEAMSASPLTTEQLDRSVARLSGKIVLPEHGRYEEVRLGWNLAVDQRPAAVTFPETAEDVVAVIDLARAFGLRVAPQGTGHNAKPLGNLEDTVLLKTERMRKVEIDSERRIARVEAGVLWLEVVEAAAEHGLATLAGSSPDVGVVGYTLGGGLSWLGRKHGLASNNVAAVELVTADGQLRRATRETEPDLFWAVRGGGGDFGVVTALEIELFPMTDVYAGVLWFPIERASEVLHTWARLAEAGLPDELTTVGRLLQLPPIEEIPEPVRGKSFVIIEAIHAGEPEVADRLLAPLRALGPVNDTIARIPMPALSHLHMDPEHPVSGVGDGVMLSELPPEAVDEIIRVAGPGSGSPLLSVEVRQLGGEISRPKPDHGALASIDAGYALYAVGIAPTPETGSAVGVHVETVKTAVEPWTARHTYLNFADTNRDPATFWAEQAHHRLRRIKTQVDPQNLIRSNHPVH
jgi:FAD binding domain/Berberine and berberine like